MAGFGGSTGVSKGYVDGAIAQSTANLSQIKTVDIHITNDVGIQVNSASGGVVSWTNFIGGFVLNKNGYTALFYTYNNLIYCRIKEIETLAQPSASDFDVRIRYFA